MRRKFLTLFLVFLASSVAFATPVDCREKGALLVLYKMKAMLSEQMDLNNFSRSRAFACELLKKQEFPYLIKARDEGIFRCQKGVEETRFMTTIKSDTPLEEAIKLIHHDSGDKNCFSNFMSIEMAKIARKVRNMDDVAEVCRAYASFNTKMFKRKLFCEGKTASY